MATLHGHIRAAPVVKREVPVATGEIDQALAGAARVVEAEYEWPFQSHASMGPACAVVDARPDGATLWTGSQKPHFARDGVARALGLAQDKVHGIWGPGPGLLRAERRRRRRDRRGALVEGGRPVRVQGMRYEGHAWDPKGPASIHRARAALDKDRAAIGHVFESFPSCLARQASGSRKEWRFSGYYSPEFAIRLRIFLYKPPDLA
jgi:nicotinate dehydrogenase subunit B